MSDRPLSSEITLTVNGSARVLELDNRTTLLDALREHLDLTGTKKGCDHRRPSPPSPTRCSSPGARTSWT